MILSKLPRHDDILVEGVPQIIIITFSKEQSRQENEYSAVKIMTLQVGS